jgi:D-lactate dehydrogenase
LLTLLQPDTERITPVEHKPTFAADRGFLHPKLTHSATSEEVQEIGDQKSDKYLSSNRTCELGMNLATGKDCQSVIFLLEELTRPQAQDTASHAATAEPQPCPR